MRRRSTAWTAWSPTSYLGGTTTYKVKLDAGGIVQASVPNSARLDVDAYSLNQRVVAWFTPDDCVVLQS